MTTQSKIVSALLGLILLAGIGCARVETPAPQSGSENTAQAPDTLAATTTELKQPARVSTPKALQNPPGTAPVSYVEALNIYRAKGAYFQFVGCRGNPGSLSIKRGVKFMFDNRDKVSRRIAIGKSATYNLIPYGFAVVTAPAAGQYNITCDGGGAAMLNVEN